MWCRVPGLVSRVDKCSTSEMVVGGFDVVRQDLVVK